MDKISYARILVDIYLSQPLFDSISVITPGTFQQLVDYHWRPKFCIDFLKLGHSVDNLWNAEADVKMNVRL